MLDKEVEQHGRQVVALAGELKFGVVVLREQAPPVVSTARDDLRQRHRVLRDVDHQLANRER